MYENIPIHKWNKFNDIFFFPYEKREREREKKNHENALINHAVLGWISIWKCNLKNDYIRIENINIFITKIAKFIKNTSDFCNAQINVLDRKQIFSW